MIQVMICRPSDGERYTYELVSSSVWIGNAPENDIVLRSCRVSERHARVVESEEGIVIVSLDMTNEILVAGEKVSGPKLVEHDEPVVIGDYELYFKRVPDYLDTGNKSLTSEDLARSWLFPISGANPAGGNPVEMPEYEALRAELNKLHSPTSGEVDWTAVVRLSDEVLKRKAKDLQIACHQALARFKSEGISGLTLGLAILAELTDNFWEHAFPQHTRLRARVGALKALFDHLEPALGRYLPRLDELEEIRRLRDSAERLQMVTRARYGDTAPDMLRLQRAIDRLLKESSFPRLPDSTLSPEFELFLGELGDELICFAHELRQERSSNPRAYNLLRLGSWIRAIVSFPMGLDGDVPIPALSESQRSHLKNLRASKRWSDLVNASESLLSSHAFAPCLHHYSAQALSQLGDDHAEARDRVLRWLSRMLQSFPGLIHLKDSSGAALCSEDTREFLVREGLYRPEETNQSIHEPFVGSPPSPRRSGEEPEAYPGFANLDDGLFSGSETEARVLEVALARELIEYGDYPLHVQVRLHNTQGLLARLLARGPEEQIHLEGSKSDLMVDFPVGPNGQAIPISLRVTVRSDDFDLDAVSKRVRLYYGCDAPLLTFFVRPRTAGTVSLLVEVQIEEDLVGSEQIWRICVERSVRRTDAYSPISCQSSPFQPRLRNAWIEPQPERSLEYRLHNLLVRLFSADELYRWIHLNFQGWSDSIPRSKASANEVAFAVLDSGLRSGRIDTRFFDLLHLQFPQQSGHIAAIRSAFLDPTSPGG